MRVLVVGILALSALVATPTVLAQSTTDQQWKHNVDALREDDAAIIDMTKQMHIVDFQMRIVLCDIAWHRTSIWKKAFRYHWRNPCTQALDEVKNGK